MEQNSSTSGVNPNGFNDDLTAINPKSQSNSDDNHLTESRQDGLEQSETVAGSEAKTNHLSNTDAHRQVFSGSIVDSSTKTCLPLIGPGSLLKNRYDLLEQIGVGGMGTVYKALDRRDIEVGNSTFIAIKVLNDKFKSDPELLKALHSEARKTQSLAHPNILTVYDFDRDGQTVFMTMEYMQGVTLDKIITGQPQGLKKTEVFLILKQICNALTYAHKRGIIHSDFKPLNVFVDINNRVKVLDFGIARLQNFSRVSSFDAGILGGVTPAYASLEMLAGLDPDPRDDIYALGCVAYELFTGKHPFNLVRIDTCIKNNLHPKRSPILTNGEWRALKKALNFKRENRTENVDSFLQDLESIRTRKKPIYFIIAIALLTFIILLSLNYNLPFLNMPFAPEKHLADSEKVLPKQLDEKKAIQGQDNLQPVPTLANVPSKTAVPPSIEAPVAQKALIAVLPDYALDLSLNKERFKIGDQLIVQFSVKEPLYVYIAVIDSLGKVTVIYPYPYQIDNYCIPGENYQVPPEDSNAALNVSGPVGTETIVAIASDKAFLVHETDFKKFDDFKKYNRVITKTLKYDIY